MVRGHKETLDEGKEERAKQGDECIEAVAYNCSPVSQKAEAGGLQVQV